MTQTNFICDQCGHGQGTNENSLVDPQTGEVVSCDKCGNKMVIEESGGVFCSFAKLNKDEIGKFFLVSTTTSDKITECDKCHREIERKNRVYLIEGESSSYGRFSRKSIPDDLVCKNCKKKQRVVDGIKVEDEEDDQSPNRF